ncbi:MAG TPA: penicillin-binding protein 2 [Acidimicrobiales bacterium]|nr:penicillin-binding protein 2 [Acidimicrobiales bacterium]
MAAPSRPVRRRPDRAPARRPERRPRRHPRPVRAGVAPTWLIGRPGRPRRRLAIALVALLAGFAAVTARLVDLQALGGHEYTAFGASQRFQQIALPADRGSIFDRNGNDLAISIPQRTVWADPRLVEDPQATAAALGEVLDLEPDEVAEVAARLGREGSKFAYVARRVSDETADAVAALELPGIFFMDEPKRFTPAGDLARSVLGQVGVDNEGLSGLELQYDELLTGEPGELIVEKDPEGRTIPGGERELEPAIRGDDLVLTIDRSMQFETERALAAQIAAKRADGGVAIVSNPRTGEILALANLARDPETGEVVAVGNNMALTQVYEPGSVNKVITVAAALEEGLVSPSTEIVVPDHLQVADHLFTDHSPHPTEPWSVTKILSESSNVGTIKLAQMLGKERLDEYIRRFGLGSKTALDFPNESAGILLDPDDYSGTSMGSIPLGQGISVTAMQMLFAYNVIANDGVYVPPKLVMETVDVDGVARPVDSGAPRRVVSESTAARLRDMLANVVEEGTGTRGGITGYSVAGKTGTARKPLPTGGYQDAEGYHYIATFAGFVPAERPELSIIVVIDEPTGDIYGGSVAAPVFADLAQYGLLLFRIAPPLVAREAAPDTAAAEAGATTTTQPGRVRAAPATSTTVPAGGSGGDGGTDPTG